MRRLEGNVVVVVAGGSRVDKPSLGGATARRLASEGASVVVADIDPDAAATTVDAITAEGGTAVAAVCDASDETSVQAALQLAVTTYGGLDGVHSNAMDMSPGTLGVDSEHTITTLPLSVWQRSLDVGLTGFFLVCRNAIPLMLERGGGSIVGTASGAVYAGEPVRVAYATAKTGMTAVVRHIASAYGRQGIRANCVAPGFVMPPAAIEGYDARMVEVSKARSSRPGSPDDIAAMVAFLLSSDGEWLNGQTFGADGGAILRP